MGKATGKGRDGPRIPSHNEVKIALEQASDKDLLDEIFRRGLIEAATIRYWEIVQRRELQARLHETKRHVKQPGREPDTIDEAITQLRASTRRHYEYVGQLFELLHQKRLDKMQEQCIWRTNTTPEFAHIGVITTRTIFDHLVVSRREALDAGTCDIESLWEYLMSDGGYRFALDLVEADIHLPPNLWASFIHEVIQGTAMSFLDVVEEVAEESANQNDENGCKEPDFIN